MLFGAYIKKLRKSRGLSLTKAAIELGMPIQRLCDIEGGRRLVKKPPSLEMMKRIANLYDHPVSLLIENTEFYQKEATIISHLTDEVEPLVDDMVKNSLEMLYEAKQYTPEMEKAATQNYRLSQDIQLAIKLIKRRASGMAPRKGSGSSLRRLGG